ncbi:MAG: hypothetical protein EU529_04155 [Promethearchaeota archaeon]|nr:MAG: hypothetical protein EU529_04155 [Candidatus Lokiarchaeota archaeon]
MKRIQYKKPLVWLLWHPHQGFWNWDLFRIIKKIFTLKLIYKLVCGMIILIDTIILFVRVLYRRVSKVGLLKTLFFTQTVPNGISILYFDLGTHKDAKELSLMVNKILPRICESYEAYGFEAIQEYFLQAQKKFVNKKNVTIIQAALCYVIPNNGKVKLYKGTGDGLGSSIYRTDYIEYEEVEAIRFSDWLREKNFIFKNRICLLRMNIEGSEYDVIMDLVNNGFAKHIDGYYGMWDDLSKIDIQRYEEFRDFLAKNQIFPFTFNGRDFLFPLRLRCIEYDIRTSVQATLRKIKKFE